ncbi:MAG: hypothetical protein DI536_16765 [Archangium gephyra]|uniref:M50 family peptidase n=1 Tax=Archangium gephyra TaxID=48 RepID=A0A2W5TH96_9BACT|nr:MAG: hypothetical protein DI536_16765 [Archangium gephyra]
MKKTELHFGRAGLLLAIVVLGSVFWDSVILTPFKLLAVMGHETGHAIASLIVGGSVEQVTLRLDESGQCLSRIPDGFFAQVAVYSAGYVGSAVISVLLLVLSFRFNARRAMLAAACAWLGLMGIFYARDAFTLFFSLGMAVAFGAGARWLPVNVVGGVNIFIASFTALYAVMDLKDDLWNSAVRAQSDASLLADLTIVPAIVWAALWTLVSVAVLITGAWLALQDKPQKPMVSP